MGQVGAGAFGLLALAVERGRLQQVLRKSDELRRALLSSVSHDLRLERSQHPVEPLFAGRWQ